MVQILQDLSKTSHLAESWNFNGGARISQKNPKALLYQEKKKLLIFNELQHNTSNALTTGGFEQN